MTPTSNSADAAHVALLAAAVRGSRPGWMRTVTVLADVAGVGIALAIAHGIRLLLGGTFTAEQVIALWPVPFLLVGFIWVNRGYALTPPHPAEELRRLTHATTLSFLILVTVTFLLRSGEVYSRSSIISAWLLSLVTVPVARAVMRGWSAKCLWWGVPVVVFGAGHTADLVVGALGRWPSRGLRPVLLLDDDPNKIGTSCHGRPIVGPVEPWGMKCAELGVSHILVAMPGVAPERLKNLWRRFGANFPVVLVVPGLRDFASLWVECKDLGGTLALELHQSLLRRSRRAVKRFLDLFLVLIAGPFIFPLLACLAVVVRLTSVGPVIYGQSRIGQNGRTFTAWKFRTMRRDAAALLDQLLASNPELRAEWERDHKLRNDPRVTWIGNILRKTSLDELPQLWNVLCGQMSLVGPRPITTAEIPKYGDQWEVYQRVLPGVTGLWQVSGRNQTTYDERVALDTFYVHNWSPWLDLVILARTVQTVLRGEGAY